MKHEVGKADLSTRSDYNSRLDVVATLQTRIKIFDVAWRRRQCLIKLISTAVADTDIERG